MFYSEFKRHRLQTLARDVSGHNKITLRFGGNPRTDFGVIEVVDFTETQEICPGVPCTEAEAWVAMKASVCHEAAHLRFTDQKVWETATKDPRLACIVNSLEDLRIERAISERFSGAARWISWYNHYFCNEYRKVINNSPPAVRFLITLMFAVLYGEIFPISEQHLVKKYLDLAARARMAATTEELLGYAEEILRDPEVQNLFPAQTEPPQMPGTRKPEKALAKTGGTQNSPASKNTKTSSSEEEKSAQPPDSPDNSSENTSEEKSDEQPKESGENKKELLESENLTQDSGEDPGNPETSEEPEEPETSSSFSKTAENEDDNWSPEDFRNEDSEDLPEDSENPSEDFNSEDFNPEAFDETFEEGEEGFENFGNDSDAEAEKEETPDEELEVEKSEEASDEEPEEELGPDPLDEARNELKIFRSRAEDGAFNLEAPPGFVISLPNQNPAWDSPDPRLNSNNRVVGASLARELQKILEKNRATRYSPAKKGSLNPAALYKSSYDPVVFRKKFVPDANDISVYLLVNSSGSMDEYVYCKNGNRTEKINVAVNAADILTIALTRLGIPHAITGFSTIRDKQSEETKEKPWHLYAKVFGTSKFYSRMLLPYNCNRDGASIRQATKELLARNERTKLLIVISDGLPSAYGGSVTTIMIDSQPLLIPEGVSDTSKAIREAEQENITVVGIHIGYTHPDHLVLYRLMFNHFIHLEDASHLPRLLGKVVKQALDRQG